MAKRPAISFKQLAPRIVGARGEYRAARVQRFEIRGNFPTTDVQEHGNEQLAGVIYDIPDYTVTLSALDVSIKLFAALTGTNPDAYPVTGVSINAIDTVDLVGDVKDESLMDYVKSIYVRRARVQSIRYTYSVDGQATEEYTFGASTRQLFTHDIVVDVLSAASSPQTLTYTPEQLKNGDYAVSVMIDGVTQKEVTTAPGADEYRIVGQSISFGTAGTTLVVAYKANPAGNNWTWITDNSIPAAISGKDIPVTITAMDTSTDHSIPRVQSVNISVNLRADSVKEMGNPEVVDYQYQIPEVTGDMSVLDTDKELIALLSTGDIEDSATEYRNCELLTARNLALKIELRDPSDPCSVSGAVLKTIYVPNLNVTGESYTSNVGNNVTYTFNFRSGDGNLIIYSGAI